MKIILLSGGSGKRLWPLSNDYRSKQFIKVMNSDNGINESQTSMIQRVWNNLKSMILLLRRSLQQAGYSKRSSNLNLAMMLLSCSSPLRGILSRQYV